MELWNWTIIRNWFIFRANVVLRFVSLGFSPARRFCLYGSIVLSCAIVLGLVR